MNEGFTHVYIADEERFVEQLFFISSIKVAERATAAGPYGVEMLLGMFTYSSGYRYQVYFEVSPTQVKRESLIKFAVEEDFVRVIPNATFCSMQLLCRFLDCGSVPSAPSKFWVILLLEFNVPLVGK